MTNLHIFAYFSRSFKKYAHLLKWEGRGRGIRTDLAVERRASLTRKDLPGLTHRETHQGAALVTELTVESREASEALRKPVGRYVTVDLPEGWHREEPLRAQAASLLTGYLSPLLPEGPALVVGLGNRDVTPDALGPRTADLVTVTRCLRKERRGSARAVAGLAPGVMGQTGMEPLELLRAVCGAVKPAFVVAVDALAARSLSRLGRSFQLTDAGIVPGEGAGSRRFALSQKTLGVPVFTLGVPTVTEASTLARDLTGSDAALPKGSFLVSPGEIDLLVQRSAAVLAEVLDRTLLA